MSIFSSIMHKIFDYAVVKTPIAETPSGPTPSAVALTSSPPPVASSVDVAAALDGLAKQSKEKLDWKVSIVDLMKLVGIESSLSHRKELATEMHFSGDINDSAAMNMWLHKEVLKKLAENGGKVPAELV